MGLNENGAGERGKLLAGSGLYGYVPAASSITVLRMAGQLPLVLDQIPLPASDPWMTPCFCFSVRSARVRVAVQVETCWGIPTSWVG